MADFILSAFADEAAGSLEEQIKAVRGVGENVRRRSCRS